MKMKLDFISEHSDNPDLPEYYLMLEIEQCINKAYEQYLQSKVGVINDQRSNSSK